MSEPKYDRGEAVYVKDIGLGVIVDEPELEEDEWTYSVRFNEYDNWGWFGESEIEDV